MTKKIGVLTSGGDCAGLNPVIRAVTHRATYGYGWQVLGIQHGTRGLLARPVQAIELSGQSSETELLRKGGTVLGTTNKGNPLAYPMKDGTIVDRSQEIIEGFQQLGLEALIGIGGDGSLEILRKLSQKGNIPFIGIPKTIDNDVDLTENAIGFSTAVDVATEALDRLQPTAASHDRVMILEVMGRDAGHIALAAGIAGGADVILIPEIPYNIEHVANHIKLVQTEGRNFALVIVAEAVRNQDGSTLTISDSVGKPRYGGIGHYLSNALAELTGAETRFTSLGHVQRGGQPSAQDRLLASAFGVYAVDLIAQGKFDRMVAWQNRKVVDVPLSEVVGHCHMVDLNGTMIQTARGLGICLGDK